MAADTKAALLDNLGKWFYACIGLPMLLFGASYLPAKDQLIWQTGNDVIMALLWVLAFILLILPIRELLRIKSRFRKVADKVDSSDKSRLYQKLYQRLYLLVMACSIVTVALLYFTENKLFVVVYAILLFAISLKRPHERALDDELGSI